MDISINLYSMVTKCALLLMLWACLVPFFATADECSDAFESMSSLKPGVSVAIECSTERQTTYKGTMSPCTMYVRNSFWLCASNTSTGTVCVGPVYLS